MKERGKSVATFNESYFSSCDAPCRKHPSSLTVGICAHCLKDKLIKLVCSDCGEQRLSSCSCSDISSNRNSCSIEVGSVGRVSFLIERESSKTQENSVQPDIIRRSTSFIKARKSCGFKEQSNENQKGLSRSRSLCSIGGSCFADPSAGLDRTGDCKNVTFRSLLGGSCRITVSDKSVRKDRRGARILKWVFGNRRSKEERGRARV